MEENKTNNDSDVVEVVPPVEKPTDVQNEEEFKPKVNVPVPVYAPPRF